MYLYGKSNETVTTPFYGVGTTDGMYVYKGSEYPSIEHQMYLKSLHLGRLEIEYVETRVDGRVEWTSLGTI